MEIKQSSDCCDKIGSKMEAGINNLYPGVLKEFRIF